LENPESHFLDRMDNIVKIYSGIQDVHEFTLEYGCASHSDFQSGQGFDESISRGYRCIHCEVRNDVQFCHYHDVPIQNKLEKVLDEVIKIIDGGISSIEDLKEDINKLRQRAGEP
jgi:hypothetical protein